MELLDEAAYLVTKPGGSRGSGRSTQSLSCAARVAGDVRPRGADALCVGVRAGAPAGRVCGVLPAPRGESRSPVAGWRAVLSRRLS
jgi:hypothetical protein